MARLAMAHIPVGDNSLRVVESMLSLLKAGGVGDQAAAYAADLIGSTSPRSPTSRASTPRSTTTPSTRSARSARIAERFAGLSPERYPDDRRAARQDDHGRRRGALLARPRRDRQRPARDADRGPAQPRAPGSSSRERAVVRRQRRRRGLGEQGRVRRAHAASSRPTRASRTSASPSRSSQPGQPSGLYHAEEAQEGFLVLAGECLAVIDGQEHPLRQWDYFHCPPGHPARPRRRRRRAVHGAHGRRPAQRVAVGDPLSARIPSPRATAPRSPRRRAPPSRPTPTVRTPARLSRAPWPDA